MRELLEKDRRITVVPHDFRNANKGTITEVSPEGFTVELDYDSVGMLKHNYCEFYTQTKYCFKQVVFVWNIVISHGDKS